jgi:hypothetical protein
MNRDPRFALSQEMEADAQTGTRKGTDAGRQADKIIARAKGTVTA